jgi:serine/threonine protein kinase
VAIKIPRNTERRKNTLLQRFSREAQGRLADRPPQHRRRHRLRHHARGDFFFVMEFVDGVDLEKVVKRDGACPLER